MAIERRISLENLEQEGLKVEGLQLSIGEIEEEAEDEWDEPAGPYHMPGIVELRKWDHRLLDRYDSSYEPTLDICEICTFGPCDLSDGKRGACGQTISNHTARLNLVGTVLGTAAHLLHARDLVDHIIEKFDADVEIDVGSKNNVEAPLIRTITGTIPKTVGDLVPILEYCEEELTALTSAASTMQEASPKDYDSKSLHGGMIDNLSLEIADLAQISAYDMPKGDEDAPLADIGMGSMDPEKPIVISYGHNVVPGNSMIEYVVEEGLEDEVEIGAICCNAHDMTRINPEAKYVGPISKALKYVRSGLPDVMVTDEQCIRSDLYEECTARDMKYITTSGQKIDGLQDVSDRSNEEIIDMLLDGVDGVFLPEMDRAGEVAIEVARAIHEDRVDVKAIPDQDELQEFVDQCIECGNCDPVCPEFLDIEASMVAGKDGDFGKLVELWDACVGCQRCTQVCPTLRPMDAIETAAEREWKTEVHKVRTGRGPINDTEIRDVGAPIVLGEIPGVVAFVGCSNYPSGGEEIARAIKELAERNYIVVTSGCVAMTAGEYEFENGQTVYEMFDGGFDRGNVTNVGSCVANAHIADACLKVANIFANVPLRDNYEEVSDYILHRLGAVGIAWGAYHQKALAIGNGVKRMGVPVILGPQGVEVWRQLHGRPDVSEKWTVHDAKADYEDVQIEPAPEHLSYNAETIEEMVVKAVKLCIRPNDTRNGRKIKLSNYIDLYKEYYDEYPPDLDRYVRSEKEVPITERETVMEMLEEEGWEPRETPDPTLLTEEERLV